MWILEEKFANREGVALFVDDFLHGNIILFADFHMFTFGKTGNNC